ncbi:MAG: dodecin domain-containing protein, partial [Deltaproteobacteria bacterium]|nr:dodecin domain-containing protein [Deltaproteobacteria bacterium]
MPVWVCNVRVNAPDLQVERSEVMSVGTYKIIELVGSSGVSWEDA